MFNHNTFGIGVGVGVGVGIGEVSFEEICFGACVMTYATTFWIALLDGVPTPKTGSPQHGPLKFGAPSITNGNAFD